MRKAYNEWNNEKREKEKQKTESSTRNRRAPTSFSTLLIRQSWLSFMFSESSYYHTQLKSAFLFSETKNEAAVAISTITTTTTAAIRIKIKLKKKKEKKLKRFEWLLFRGIQFFAHIFLSMIFIALECSRHIAHWCCIVRLILIPYKNSTFLSSSVVIILRTNKLWHTN